MDLYRKVRRAIRRAWNGAKSDRHGERREAVYAAEARHKVGRTLKPRHRRRDRSCVGAALALLAVFLALPGLGCASGSFRLGQRDPKPASWDNDVVRELVCHGREAEAKSLVALRGGSSADETEAVERARVSNRDRTDCCPTAACYSPAPPAGGVK
jgi:hypothetical protein